MGRTTKATQPPKAPRKKSAASPRAKAEIASLVGELEASPVEAAPFWETKSLAEMSRAEWDSLCDGCAQCCMVKLEEEETSTFYLTRLSCKMLDIGSCRCSDYENRHKSEPDCIVFGPDNVMTYSWLPQTCAYRRLSEGRGLAWWHPLVSGDPETVHQAGVSVRTWARSEKGVKESAIERYIIGIAR